MLKDPVAGRDIREVPYAKFDNSNLVSVLRKSHLKLGSHRPSVNESK